MNKLLKRGKASSLLDPDLVSAVEGKTAKSVNPADFRYISLGLPPYVLKQIKRRVAEEGTTMRYEVLRCLKAGGHDVNDADLIQDARRHKVGSKRTKVQNQQ